MIGWIEPRKHGCRLAAFQQHGLQVVVLENRALRVTVLPDKGSDVVELRLKELDLDVLWASPTGLRDWRAARASSPGLGPMMDFYEGGWLEALPSGGPPAAHAGTEWGQHGETPSLPWEWGVVADRPEEVAVVLRVRLLRYPLVLQKVVRLRGDRAVLELDETLVNEGSEPVDLMWGHHPVLGAPFLAGGCSFHLPGGTVRVPDAVAFDRQRALPAATGRWPLVADREGGEMDLSRMPPPEARRAEFLYITDVPEGWYAVTNPALKAGFGLSWDPAVFPHLWYWQVARGGSGYPWFGRTYSMALEPWTSWPGEGLSEAVRRGTARRLEAGGCIETHLAAVLFRAVGRVERIASDGSVTSGAESD